MSDLRAACDRLRINDYPDSHDTADGYVSELREADLWTVANEYLSTHPADGAEPIDTYRVMPRDWHPEVEPGRCVELETAKPAVVLDGELLRVLGEYLPILERAELDPETWARLTEGTGIATLNRYRHIIAKAGNGGRA